jgi:hypothetical protein
VRTAPAWKLSFREFFPYELSPDRTRARVGWDEHLPGIRTLSAGFDVEVRKTGGLWLPVECRQVSDTFGPGEDPLPAPVRPVH